MHHILFLVCPFSYLEQPLKRKFGKEHFFLTAPAAIFGWNQIDHLIVIRDLIVQQKVNEICLVTDTSCRFIDAVINRSEPFGVPAEQTIMSIYIKNYFNCFKDKSIAHQRYQLAKLIMQQQIEQLTKVPLTGECIAQYSIIVKGLVSSSGNFLE